MVSQESVSPVQYKAPICHSLLAEQKSEGYAKSLFIRMTGASLNTMNIIILQFNL